MHTLNSELQSILIVITYSDIEIQTLSILFKCLFYDLFTIIDLNQFTKFETTQLFSLYLNTLFIFKLFSQ